MRLFIAINFDDKTKDEILAVQSRLKKMGQGRFTAPENLHLTLAFLGEVYEEDVADLKSLMNDIEVPAMDLRFSRVGAFRNESELWWIGLDEDPKLMALQEKLIRYLKADGFSPDGKKFRPHITLAREMHLGRVEYRELLPQKFTCHVEHMSLMLSERTSGKLTYSELYKK